MGFFDRITSVFKGKASNTLNKMETANPEAVYEAALQERLKKYQEMKKATAELAVLRKRSQDELEEKTRKLAEIDPMVRVAVESGDEESALVLLEEKETLTNRVATLQTEVTQTQAQVEEMTAALRTYQGEIESLRREKEQMLSRKANAEAQIQMQDTLSKVSTNPENQGLANVREQIERMAVDADLDTASARHSVNEKIAKSRAQAQLDAIKAQMAAKNGGGAPAAAADDAPEASNTDGGAPTVAETPKPPKRTL